MQEIDIGYVQLDEGDNSQTEKGTEFPSDPEERFASVISSIGNHAGKQITFLSIPSIPGVIITPSELHGVFLENSGRVWKTNGSVQKAHAQQSLVPIGTVAEEVVIRDGSDTELVGFTQTEAGRIYGDPVSKFLLKYAAEHNMPFEKILGTTTSPTGSRAPYSRARILEYLFQRKDDSNIRFADVKEHLQTSGSLVRRAMIALQENSLLMFESVDPEKSQGKFTYTLKDPDFSGTVHLEQRTSIVVLEAIKSLQESGVTEFEIDTVLSEIRRDNPTFKRGTARVVLSELARDKVGYLTRGEFKNREIQSTVTILQEGVDFINDVLIPLRTALTDTPEGEELRQEWRDIPWRQYAPGALRTHKENSRNANMTDPAVMKEALVRIINAEPGIRTSEINQRLQELGLPHKAPTRNLSSLLKAGIVGNKTEGKAVRWFLTEENEGDKNASEL